MHEDSGHVLRQGAGRSDAPLSLKVRRQRAQQRPTVFRGRVLLLLRQQLQQPMTHGKAPLSRVLLGLRLLHPSLEHLLVDCQKLVTHEILFPCDADCDILLRPLLGGRLIPLDVDIERIVRLQRQERRSELL